LDCLRPRLHGIFERDALLRISGNLYECPFRAFLRPAPRWILNSGGYLLKPARALGGVDHTHAITLRRLGRGPDDNVCLDVVAAVELFDEVFGGSYIGTGMILPQLVGLNVVENQDGIVGSFLGPIGELLEDGGRSLVFCKPITGVLKVGKDGSFGLVLITTLSERRLGRFQRDQFEPGLQISGICSG
jgi:hypothetical protein